MVLSEEVRSLTKNYRFPLIVVDLSSVALKYREISQKLSDIEIFYAMKANDHTEILNTFHKENSGFEVSSQSETERLIKMGVKKDKIICLNPIKSPEFLGYLQNQRINIVAFDSKEEVEKIKKYAPDSWLVIRVNVPNDDSDWPLTNKFGVDYEQAMELLNYAKSSGLRCYGITFHVGSQCRSLTNWFEAFRISSELCDAARANGINLEYITLGGGLPIQHLKPIPTLDEIGAAIGKARSEYFKKYPDMRFSIEPGRGLVGDSAIMVTRVVGKALRGKDKWLYLDVGVFNGLMETIEGFEYKLETEKNDTTEVVTIAGPSCDSVDIMFKNISLSKVNVGDKVFILNAGAYTNVYAAPFNGFPIPEFVFINK